MEIQVNNFVQQSSVDVEKLLDDLANELGELHNQNAFLQSVVANANIAPWRVLLADGDRFISPSFARMLGYDSNELSENPVELRKTVHPEDFRKLFRGYVRHIRSRGSQRRRC